MRYWYKNDLEKSIGIETLRKLETAYVVFANLKSVDDCYLTHCNKPEMVATGGFVSYAEGYLFSKEDIQPKEEPFQRYKMIFTDDVIPQGYPAEIVIRDGKARVQLFESTDEDMMVFTGNFKDDMNILKTTDDEYDTMLVLDRSLTKAIYIDEEEVSIIDIREA